MNNSGKIVIERPTIGGKGPLEKRQTLQQAPPIQVPPYYKSSSSEESDTSSPTSDEEKLRRKYSKLKKTLSRIKKNAIIPHRPTISWIDPIGKDRYGTDIMPHSKFALPSDYAMDRKRKAYLNTGEPAQKRFKQDSYPVQTFASNLVNAEREIDENISRINNKQNQLFANSLIENDSSVTEYTLIGNSGPVNDGLPMDGYYAHEEELAPFLFDSPKIINKSRLSDEKVNEMMNFEGVPSYEELPSKLKMKAYTGLTLVDAKRIYFLMAQAKLSIPIYCRLIEVLRQIIMFIMFGRILSMKEFMKYQPESTINYNWLHIRWNQLIEKTSAEEIKNGVFQYKKNGEHKFESILMYAQGILDLWKKIKEIDSVLINNFGREATIIQYNNNNNNEQQPTSEEQEKKEKIEEQQRFAVEEIPLYGGNSGTGNLH